MRNCCMQALVVLSRQTLMMLLGKVHVGRASSRKTHLHNDDNERAHKKSGVSLCSVLLKQHVHHFACT